MTTGCPKQGLPTLQGIIGQKLHPLPSQTKQIPKKGLVDTGYYYLDSNISLKETADDQ